MKYFNIPSSFLLSHLLFPHTKEDFRFVFHNLHSMTYIIHKINANSEMLTLIFNWNSKQTLGKYNVEIFKIYFMCLNLVSFTEFNGYFHAECIQQ